MSIRTMKQLATSDGSKCSIIKRLNNELNVPGGVGGDQPRDRNLAKV